MANFVVKVWISVILGLLQLSAVQLGLTGISGRLSVECTNSTGNKTASDLQLSDQCFSHADCKRGGKCLFKGCARHCFDLQPCERVICKEGFVCQGQELPCLQRPCQKQANCITLEQYRCRAQPICTGCLAGFEPQKDQYGCNVSPCKCVPSEVPKCGSTCFNLCAYGFEMENGCLTCRCRPAPRNPCSNTDCGSNDECRFVDIPCETGRSNCKPKEMCVPKIKSLVDDRCSMLDSTTLGKPVLESNMATPLNCSGDKSCPDNTICLAMGNDVSMCCWQHTQASLFEDSPKRGYCPFSFMFGQPNSASQRCEIDGQCAGEQKCCYRAKTVANERREGVCVEPLHRRIGGSPLCVNTSYQSLLRLLQLLRICPEN